MKTATVWLNKSQVRRVKNIHNWKDEEVYQAHTQKTDGFVPYVLKAKLDKAVDCLKKIHETKNPEHASALIKELKDL